MTTPAAIDLPPATARPFSAVLRVLLFAATLVGLHFAIVGWASSSLGCAFATVGVGLLLPSMSAHSIRDAVIAAAVFAAYVGVQFSLLSNSTQALHAMALLVSVGWSLVGPTLLVPVPRVLGLGVKVRFDAEPVVVRRSVLAGFVTLIAIAWLTCPVWLPRFTTFPQPLVELHPLLVLNGLLAPNDAWTHRPLMYGMTRLGQDMPYAMPMSPWLSIALHAGIGAVTTSAGFGISAAMARSARARRLDTTG
ncbi:MAG: hypothetical protein QM770_06435 [Tepidisphaeraceae bacterium]